MLAIENPCRREDAERFVAEVRDDEPELASYLRIDERKLEAGGLNLAITVGRFAARRDQIAVQRKGRR